MKKEILKREIRFVIHLPEKDNYREDMHYVKEQITYSDGTTEPNSYLLKNFKRPVWVTKPAFQNHKEKKEFEHIDKLFATECTQSQLNSTVAKLLNKPYLVNTPQEIKNNPYVYGYDISSTSHIKLKSLTKNNFIQSPYTLCAFDIETNPETGEINLISISTKTKSFTTVLKSYVPKITTFNKDMETVLQTYLPEYSNHSFDFKICDTEISLIREVFKVLHTWKPDFLVIWSMDFDIPTILDKLTNAKINPALILCDPSIPNEYKMCRYKQGIKKKVTASGVIKPINPSLQWHTLICSSSFYVIDAMCAYRQLRIAQQEEPSYSLDAILTKELSKQKLKFKEADEYKGTAWHIHMQKNFFLEYVAYNLYDTIALLELDEKTKDLSHTLPSFAGISDFSRFNSNPKKIVDALFMFGLEKNLVIGTAGKVVNKVEENEEDIEYDEFDVENNDTLDLKNWIQTLPQHLLLHEGVPCLKEFPNLSTNIRLFVFDADVVSSYPSVTNCCNVSKETTFTEVIEIRDVPEHVFREENLGFIVGDVNTLSYFSNMFEMPSIDRIF